MAPARRTVRRIAAGARARLTALPLPRNDLVLVVAPQNRGWILETLSVELAARATGSTRLHYGLRPLPPARTYFFSHYMLFVQCLGERRLRREPALVFFTHPSHAPERTAEVMDALRSATKVISMSSLHAAGLVAAGLPESQVEVALPGVDLDRFPPHERGAGVVGLCSAYYERKAPEAVLALPALMPHRRFRLLGRGWRESPVFPELARLPNLEYLELDYSEYPAFYEGIDVLVSPSHLEGGPIPLLEAMASNCVPVATRTGFAPDLITDGVNGFLCHVGAPAEVMAGLVDRALVLDGDITSTVSHLTWDRFAQHVLSLSKT